MAPTTVSSPAGRADEMALFEHQAEQVMRALRESLLRVFEELPRPVQRAADLEKAIGLSRTLAWQVHRLAMSPNLLAAGAHVPGAGAFRQAMRAARAGGASAEDVARVERAFDEFERLVQQHAAGDRDTFATMINSLAGDEADTIDVKTRRQIFRGNSQAWGLQVKVSLATVIIHPGSDSSRFDMIFLRGLRDIRRLRSDVPFRVSSRVVLDSHQQATESCNLDNNTMVGPTLLKDFCTQPCPELTMRTDNGHVHSYLPATPLGTAGQQTVYLADITRDIAWQDEGTTPNHHVNFATITKPMEMLVLDTLIHRAMFDRVEPTARVFGSLDRLAETDPTNFSEQDVLSINLDVHHLGTGVGAAATPHVPRYSEMLESVCDRIGWDASQMDVYRCMLEYPILNTMVHTHFGLPEEGNW